MGLLGGAGGSGLNNTSWLCTPLTPNQLARARHVSPSHSLLISWVPDHRTFLLTYSTKVHQSGIPQNRAPHVCLLCSPLAWLTYVPTQVGVTLHSASTAPREDVI